MNTCSHKFLGSSTCALCGWVLPSPYKLIMAPIPHGCRLHTVDGITYWECQGCGATAFLLRKLLHTPSCGIQQQRTPVDTVIVPCPECFKLAVHSALAPILTCGDCGQEWAHEPWRTPEEVIAFIRRELAENCDASGRRFYSADRVLFAVAQAVDALPTNRGPK